MSMKMVLVPTMMKVRRMTGEQVGPGDTKGDPYTPDTPPSAETR
jgi:hypothetical protein